MQPHLSTPDFSPCVIGDFCGKSLLCLYLELVSLLPNNNVRVLGLTVRSYLFLKQFFFLQDEWLLSSFTSLNVATQFSQHNLLKRLFFPCAFLYLHEKSGGYKCMCLIWGAL